MFSTIASTLANCSLSLAEPQEVAYKNHLSENVITMPDIWYLTSFPLLEAYAHLIYAARGRLSTGHVSFVISKSATCKGALSSAKCEALRPLP